MNPDNSSSTSSTKRGQDFNPQLFFDKPANPLEGLATSLPLSRPKTMNHPAKELQDIYFLQPHAHTSLNNALTLPKVSNMLDNP